MRIKLTFYGLRLMAMLLLCCGAVTMQAQNNYFSVVGGMPHLPVFANTAAVPAAALKPGAMIYSTADGTVMIYSGDTWDSFCTQQLALTTGAYAQFTVVGGVPCLPVFATTAVTSTTGKAGALYYPSDNAGVRINNSLNWFTPNTLVAAPATTTATTAGNLAGLAGGVAIPVMAANPTFAATDKGTVYLNSTDFKLHVNNGTAWVAVDCGACPAYAGGVTVNVDDPVNMTNIVGGYSYFQKTGVTEGTHLYRWRIATDASGTGAALDPTTTIGYTPGYSDALDGKYLQFEVRPRATAGILGTAVTSPWTLIHNCPPQVNGVLINGDFTNMMANTFTYGGYSYFDYEGNVEAGTGQSYRWFLSATAGGTSTTALSTSTGYTYTYTDADDGKYLNLGVITKATKGYSTSVEGVSSYLLKNCPPQAAAALLSPVDLGFSAPTLLPVSYTYYDKEGNTEGSSVINWYRADDAAGTTNKTTLGTGTNASPYTYTYTDADNGKYLLADVTPKAASGYSTGTTIASPTVQIWNCPPQVGAVTINGDFAAMTSNTFSYGGYSYYDREGDPENTSATTYRWFLSTGAGGTGTTMALGTSSGYTYTYTDGDDGKYLNLGVITGATKGYSTSAETIGSFQLKNCPPQVSGVTIQGTLTVNSVLTAGYAYYDKEGNAEGTSTYQWYQASDAAGTGKTAISGATGATYTLVGGDSGKFIGVGVTPKATTGYSIGTESLGFSATAIP